MSDRTDTFIDAPGQYAAWEGQPDTFTPITPRREATAPVAYLLPEQKAEILRLTARARAEGLLDTPRFTALMLGINRLSETQAAAVLDELHQLAGHLPAENVRVVLARHFAGRVMQTTTALNTAR